MRNSENDDYWTEEIIRGFKTIVVAGIIIFLLACCIYGINYLVTNK